MWMQREGSHLCVGYHAARRVTSLVQLRLDAPPRGGSRMANECDYRFQGVEYTSAPILSDVAKEAMLDLNHSTQRF
jgi:hypothetical protein